MARNRAIKVKSAVGDELKLLNLKGRDELSRPFRYELILLSESDRHAFHDLLGTDITVTMSHADGSERYFHGLVSEFACAGTEGEFARYRAVLRPWIWFLSRTHDCRIFQEKNAIEIVKEVFGAYGFAEFEDRLNGSFNSREYCVQYRESDFAFVSRLLESEGVTFFFEHEDGKHTLVLSDGEHQTVPGFEEVPFFPESDLARRERDHIFSWTAISTVQSGAYVHTSYDFKKPKADLMAKLEQPMAHEIADGEIYDYPGPHIELGHGDSIAKTRLEEELAHHHRLKGKGTVEGLYAGCLFSLIDYPRQDQNREYLVIAIEHEIWEDEYRSRGAPEEDDVYNCEFEAMPSDQPFRPERRTYVPTVLGPQTAVVTGPAGEEIHTDQYGRVKVQFHWDRLNPADETSSCWVRVSQIWAGSGYGWITIPRIGQEVIVDFLEGDPDQPIITGRVYNANQMPPYGLPANATQSGIKSNSSKGGGGSNEIRFEDKKGDEQVYIHAEKNQDEVVENDKTQVVHHDETLTVDNNRTRMVGVDESVTIGNKQSIPVGVNQPIAVGANQTETVGSNRSDSVGMNETRNVGLAQQMSIGAARNVSVGADKAHQIGAADSWAIGAARSTKIGQDESLDVGNNRTTNIGDNESLSVGKDQSVDVGKTFSLQAGDEISLTTGKASIVMRKDGTITIKGKDIKIEGSGKIDVKASQNITMKGQKILQN